MLRRQIWQVSCFHFRQWRRNPRIILVFFMALLLSLYLSDNTASFARNYGTTVQVMEPFVWAFGDGNAIMLSMVLLILLFADLPLLGSAVPYYLIRIRRKVWILGELLYIGLGTVLYCAVLLGATSLFCANLAFPGNVWSQTGALLGYSGVGEKVALPASVKAMEMSDPYTCAVCVFILVLLYALFNITWMQMFCIRLGQAGGIISVFILNMFGLLFQPQVLTELLGITDLQVYQVNLIAGWLSPLNHATYYMHNFGYDYLPRLWTSIVMFIILIIGNMAVIYRGMRRYNFTFIQVRN